MQVETLKAEVRTPHGSRSAARLRKTGKIPGIIYGHQKTPEPIALDRHEIELLLAHGAHVAHVEIAGKSQPCLLRDVQYDHLGSLPTHVDFARVDLNEKVHVKVPLELGGHAKGQTEGGTVFLQLADLEVECLALKIPDVIRVNITNLALNATLYAREIEMPEGVVARTEPETIVAICREVREVEVPVPGAAPVEGAAAEPEIIAKGKIEKEGEGEGEAAAAPAEKKKEKKEKE